MSIAEEDKNDGAVVGRRALPQPLPAELAPGPTTTTDRGPGRAVRARHRFLFAVEAFLLWCGSFFLLSTSGVADARAAVVALLPAAAWVTSFSSVAATLRLKRPAAGAAVVALVGTVAGAVIVSALAFWGALPTRTPPQVAAMSGVALAVGFAALWFSHRILAIPRRVLIVGASPSAGELVRAIEREGVTSVDLVGVVGDELEGAHLLGSPFLGRVHDLPTVIVRERPDLVVVAADSNRQDVFAGLLRVADAGFAVVGLPEFYEQTFGCVPVRHLTPAWFMSVLHLYQKPYPRAVKRVSDLVIAALALVVTAPLLVLVLLLVRRTPGPAIFRQTRLGEGGRPFTIYKFRTMREDAEADGVALWASERDPRATRVGRLLRKTRIDELPQLLNVLKGEMSIVGPRPERPEYLAELVEAVPFWETRNLLKPGITGWAQVSDGYASDYTTTERKLSYDLWYLRHRSLAVDLLVCARTAKRLLSGWGAR